MLLLRLIVLHVLIISHKAQETLVRLNQGNLVGLKIFPESSRFAVYSYLGVPYAEAPIGQLRFAPPKQHNGWNKTLHAVKLKSICPQLLNTVYDEVVNEKLLQGELTDEDCLYLNIWVPESDRRYDNLPVLVVVTGEDMSYDWARYRASGLNLASEGIIVISIQYRSNIFGWISVDNKELPGNYGLQDIQLALKWITLNIRNFGGNPNQIVFLGHGSSGVPIALSIYYLLQKISKNPYISKLILMSGGDVSRMMKLSSDTEVIVETSHTLIKKLGCQYEGSLNIVASCLRKKSTKDLLQAYESAYKQENVSFYLGPKLPSIYTSLLQNESTKVRMPPLIIGIGSNEGAFWQDYWLDLARESYESLQSYINHTVLPNLLGKISNNINSDLVLKILFWNYFSVEGSKGVSQLLEDLQRITSEATYEAPFYELLQQFIYKNNSTFAYVIHYSGAMDIRGKFNLFGGVSHTSDLPLLFGPSLFQQIARRRFNSDEEQIYTKLKRSFINFVKSDIGSTPVEEWMPYTSTNRFIYNMGNAFLPDFKQTIKATNQLNIQMLSTQQLFTNPASSFTSRNKYKSPYLTSSAESGLRINTSSSSQYDYHYEEHFKHVFQFWNILLPYINNNSHPGIYIKHLKGRDAELIVRYRQGFFLMLLLVCILLICLCLCVYLLRRSPLSSSTNNQQKYCL